MYHCGAIATLIPPVGRDLGPCLNLLPPHRLHQPVELSDAVSQAPALLEKRSRDCVPLTPQRWVIHPPAG